MKMDSSSRRLWTMRSIGPSCPMTRRMPPPPPMKPLCVLYLLSMLQTPPDIRAAWFQKSTCRQVMAGWMVVSSESKNQMPPRPWSSPLK